MMRFSLKVRHELGRDLETNMRIIYLYLSKEEAIRVGMINAKDSSVQNNKRLDVFREQLENSPICTKVSNEWYDESVIVGLLHKSDIQYKGIFIEELENEIMISGLIWEKFYNGEDELFIEMEI